MTRNWWITWDDSQQMPDNGIRHEAIGGDLYGTPACTVRHQQVCLRLMIALDDILDPYGEVVIGPIGVEFPVTEEGVQPDLLFVSDERRGIIADPWLRGAPDLMVEVTSPITAVRDRGLKRDLYQRQGVAQYWIVDPDADCIEVWTFGEEPALERFTETLPVRLDEQPIGEIDLTEVFRED